MNGKTYERYVQGRAKKSPLLLDCTRAFVIGGMICTGGEALRKLYESLGMSLQNAGTLTSVTLVFVTALLTGLGIFDNIAKRAGGGTLVPITGFANSVVSPALEFKAEGHILGTGAKMFNLAGPVIVYGCGAASLFGFIYWIIEKI